MSPDIYTNTSGSFGIGKTTLGAKLDVLTSINAGSTVNGTSLCIAGDCKTAWSQVGGGTNFWSGTKNGNIWNGDSGAGSVGIGTAAPSNPLHVVSGAVNTAADSLTTATAQITGPNWAMDGVASNGTFLVATNNTAAVNVGGSIGFAGRYSGTAQATFAAIKGASENGSYDGYLAFGTRISTDPVSAQILERMRIKGNGNVGIGSTAPGKKLEIATGSGVTDGIRLTYAGGVTSEGFDLQYLNSGQTTAYIDSRYQSASAAMQFRMQTAGTPVNAMTMLGGGNVGIGTTNPGVKLQVDGQGGTGDILVLTRDTNNAVQASRGGIIEFRPAYDANGQGNIITTNYWGDANQGTLTLNAYNQSNQLVVHKSGSVGIGKTTLGANLDVLTSINAGSTVNGTSLCIAGDCKTAWSQVGDAVVWKLVLMLVKHY